MTVSYKEIWRSLEDKIAALYLKDDRPWVVGYSGGKDSTAVLSLVWKALKSLEPAQRTKVVHVISTNTMVENPLILNWATTSLKRLRAASKEHGLPIEAHLLRPEVEHSFWVNLIGRGYASPRQKFRWCTDRLKIKPSNKFIQTKLKEHGEVILLLGTRKAESHARARSMERLEAHRQEADLSPNASLPGSWVYSPIEDWENDDVWCYIMQHKKLWGHNNKGLLTLYQGASDGGECPLVVDTGTPSCGKSRFGCWVCTMVDQDKSMQALISNNHHNDWMRPLLTFRNELDLRDDAGNRSDRHLRDFRRTNGTVTAYSRGLIPGPYLQHIRHHWLTRLLQTQQRVREMAPEEYQDIELITLEELEEIRRMWVYDKHEVEDALPGIYTEIMGEPYPGKPLAPMPYGPKDVEWMAKESGDDPLLFERMRAVLATVAQHCPVEDPKALRKAMMKVLKRHRFKDEDDALEWANRRLEERKAKERAIALKRIKPVKRDETQFDLFEVLRKQA